MLLQATTRSRVTRLAVLVGCLLSAGGPALAQSGVDDPWDALELEMPTQQAVPDLPQGIDEALARPAATSAATEAAEPVTRSATTDDQPIARSAAAADETKTTTEAPATDAGWVRSTLALAAVVALIVLLAWGYRTVAGGTALPLGRPRRTGVLEVIARTTIGPRQSVCLVRCGPRMVLLGLSGERISALDVISDAAVVADLAGEEARRSAGTDEFAALLTGEGQAYDRDEPEVDETSGVDERGLGAMKQRLTETINRIRAARPAAAVEK